MQLSEVLENISKKYVLGAVEFYDKQKPNAWQDALDKLEGALLLHRGDQDYDKKMQPHYRELLTTTEKLLSAYKAIAVASKSSPSIQDSFTIGDENKVRVLQSLSENTCRICGTDIGVRAAHHHEHGSALYCTNCLRSTA